MKETFQNVLQRMRGEYDSHSGELDDRNLHHTLVKRDGTMTIYGGVDVERLQAEYLKKLMDESSYERARLKFYGGGNQWNMV